MGRRRKRRYRTSASSRRDSELGAKVIGCVIIAVAILYVVVTYPWLFWLSLLLTLAVWILPKYLDIKGRKDTPQPPSSLSTTQNSAVKVPSAPITVFINPGALIQDTSSTKLSNDNTGRAGRPQEDLESLKNYVRRLDPYQFEMCVAKAFQQSGWHAHSTKGSGDFGADVIAERPGIRVVVQVKKYQANVSLGAVQEIVAARPHYEADCAVVLTSANGYTTSAQLLAGSNGVLLWTLEELRCLRLGITPSSLLNLTPPNSEESI